MQRRDVLKGLGVTVGGAVLPRAAWASTLDTEGSALVAIPVRGLVRREGKLLQPIRITLRGALSGAHVVTKLDGTEVDSRTLADQAHGFEVLAEPVSAPRTSHLSISVNGAERTGTVERKPVRKVLVYVLPHSHHDLGYTDLQAAVEEKQVNNIQLGIELARKTQNYPEGSRFVWNLEALWGADLFLKRRPEADRAEFREAVRKGWLGINGSYANELTGLCRPEELVQLFRFGVQLGRDCGVPVRAAMMSDVPGFSWGMVTALSQAGIRYFSGAPNYFDRIGTFMVAWQDKPFWWISPSGKERVLFWVPWTGYAMSHVMKLSDDWVDKYQDRLDAADFPYDISYMRWSGHGDNAVPDPELSDWIRDWNSKYEWPRFHISTTDAAFSAFEKAHGDKLPELRGDLTPYWEDGAASSALETALSRNAAEKIVQAEVLAAAFRPEAYEAARYREAWRNVLLYSEHTWGAYNSVSNSESPFVLKQWEFKRKFALDAAKQAEELLSRVAAAGGGNGAEVEIWNSTSWARSEVVILSTDMSRVGDYAEDEHGKATPTQRLSSGELALMVEGMQPFSRRRYRLSAKKAAHPSTPVTVQDGRLANGKLRVTVDPKTGDVIELVRHGDLTNLIDTSAGAANRFLYLSGNDVDHLIGSGEATIFVQDAGPLVATVRIESSAPSCNRLVRLVSLAAGADFVMLNNLVDKQRVALNPDPGKEDQGGAFAQRGNKESLQFAFPFAVAAGEMTLDIPLAVMRPDADQLPGSCKNWLPVGRWIDVSSKERGVTCATLDAPLAEIGTISATMLGSQKNPEVWRKSIPDTQTFYSWVMNNHWGTNYRAYQEGPVAFRYALRPHLGNSAAEKERFAVGLTQPLVAAAAGSEHDGEPLLQVSSPDVIVQSLSLSEDGNAWIVRLFGASGEARQAKLLWSAKAKAGKMWISNLAEESVAPVTGDVPVAGWQLVTVRTERNV